MRRFAGIGLAILTLSGCSLNGGPGFQSMAMGQQPSVNSTWAPRGQTPLDAGQSSPSMMSPTQTTLAASTNPYAPTARTSLMQTPLPPTPANGLVQTNYTPGQPLSNPSTLNLEDPATLELMNQTTVTSKQPEVVRSAQVTEPAPMPPVPPAPSSVAAAPTEDRVVGVTPALRVVNSPRFTLGYELRDLGTNALSTLELWSTIDTRTWTRMPSAQFQPSSCTVSVAGEGTYGFTVVSRDGQHPRPGESPQVWVTVDTSKPVVAIQEIDMNLINKPKTLVIRWNAHDRNFGPRPITISYAEKLDGPWMALIANIPNSGHYECVVPTGLPANLFIRLEATDMAGNVGMVTTSQSVQVGPEKEVVQTAPQPQALPDKPLVSPVSVLGVTPGGD